MDNIPISVAEQISKDYKCPIVVIYAIDSEGYEQVVTFGKTKIDCICACNKGNAIKRLMQWPEEYCYAEVDVEILKGKE